jgi:hypothetical protein
MSTSHISQNLQIRSILKSVLLEKISYRRNFRHQVGTSDVYRMYHHCSDQGSLGDKLDIHWNFRQYLEVSAFFRVRVLGFEFFYSSELPTLRRNFRQIIWTYIYSLNTPFNPNTTSIIPPRPSPLLSQTLERISRINYGISLLGVSLDSPLLGRSDPHHLLSN